MEAAPPLESLSRSLVGRYELMREIGRGGMSTVYAARDEKHDREVAIKVLQPELGSALGTERFHREIRVVAKLQHPHILPLFDSGHIDGLLYFIMPFVEGASLRSLLEQQGALPVDDAVRITRQLADALDYAHARGVVHRDVKPENVLLVGSQALLADFGIARSHPAAGAGESPTLTIAGIAVGTPAYMSPEQALGEEVDGRSDIYSLGCVFFEMVSGSPPFTAPSLVTLVQQHVAVPPPPLTSPRGAVSAGIQAAAARALAKEPAERFPNAGAFAAALEQAVVSSRTPSPEEVRLRVAERRNAAKPRVLVLDFENIAGAADVGWLSTGIVETVSADLRKIASIAVVAQDAATRRKVEAAREGRVVDVELAAEIGRSVGARWVVWGAFQKFGSRIRITPHFLDVDSGTMVGGEKIDGEVDDIFALQDRIVAGIAAALRIELTTAEREEIGRAETVDIRAYEHYARGYQEWLKFGKESIRAAAEHFRKAIEIDPDYAAAYAGLGMMHGPMYIATGNPEVLAESTRLLERALELDPTIGEAYAWLTYAQFRQNRFDDATRTALEGVERNPRSDVLWYMLGCSYLSRSVGSASPEIFAPAVPPLLRAISVGGGYIAAYMVLGSIYAVRGLNSYAVGLIDRAVALELAPGTGLTFIGAGVQRAMLHISEGDLHTASALVEDAIRRYTGADHVYAENITAFAHWARGCIGERTGALDEAVADFRRAAGIAEEHDHRIGIGAHWVKGRFGLARALHRQGRTDEAALALDEGIDMFRSRGRFIWTWFLGGLDAEVSYELASAEAALGRTHRALDSLREAADAGWADVAWLRNDPAFEQLRDSPEVQRICVDAASRVSLPPPVGSGGLPPMTAGRLAR